MFKKIAFIVLLCAVAALAVTGWTYYWRNLRGAGPAFLPPVRTITNVGITPTSTLPLTLPEGFSISVFAKDVPGARVLLFDSHGNLWVSQTSKGIVSLVEMKDGKVDRVSPLLRGLNNPHGLAISPSNPNLLYIAEENKISRVLVYAEDVPKKVVDLPPAPRGHFTRTIGFGPDGRLYVSIGSSCNVCYEEDERLAAVYSMNPDGTDFKPYASGLRNAVFFRWHPVDGRMWATEMGRDGLGDDVPPDEINIVEEGKNYGWPWCYGKNVDDTTFVPNNVKVERVSCAISAQPSYIDLQSHSAPLGLAFIPEDGWPTEFQHNLIVAYHGSWNRTTPTGYKLVRISMDERGDVKGIEDFVTGWLTSQNQALGRPVDVVAGPDGALYVSDDKAGVIYKIAYSGAPVVPVEPPPTNPPPQSDGCKVTGCSSHVCSAEDVVTTCEFLSEYTCYKNARCERQASGECGWTQTPEFLACIDESRKSAPNP